MTTMMTTSSTSSPSLALLTLLVSLSALAACSPRGSGGGDEDTGETQCADRMDDDGDGQTDCADEDCAGLSCSTSRAAFCGELQCGGGEAPAECEDGLDNDADGVADCDDLDCANTCACGPCDDTCGDGLDNDLDGVVDDGCPCAYTNTSRGVCGFGEIGRGGVCAPPVGFQTNEVACDGQDNDCDGITDDGCLCAFQDAGVGVCAHASIDLRGRCARPLRHQADETECDGWDNDCDGEVDEGCQVCDYDGSSRGVCAFGLVTARTTECFAPASFQSNETRCDGVDNDCDGEVDEGCRCSYQDKGFGVCSRARLSDGECVPPDGFAEEETTCDGVDNDCDGEVDEGCISCAFRGLALGVCVHGWVASAGDGSPVCQAPVTFESGRETQCGDLLDNDCDGAVDAADSDCSRVEACSDGRDNDLDGFVDCDDPECAGDAECGHVVFTTSAAFEGDLGGVAFADFACRREALRAGLDGGYRAVLSTSGAGARERLTLRGSVYNRARGAERVAERADDLFAEGVAIGALAYDAEGAEFFTRSIILVGPGDDLTLPFDPVVWTGSTGAGATSGMDTCGDWSSARSEDFGMSGVVDKRAPSSRTGDTDEHLTQARRSCDERAHLICLGGQTAEDCATPGDQDGDGAVDADDPDCALGRERCQDGIDNDLDGLVDCSDVVCAGACNQTVFVEVIGNATDETPDERCEGFGNEAGLGDGFVALATFDASEVKTFAEPTLRGPIQNNANRRDVVLERGALTQDQVRAAVESAAFFDARRAPTERRILASQRWLVCIDARGPEL